MISSGLLQILHLMLHLSQPLAQIWHPLFTKCPLKLHWRHSEHFKLLFSGLFPEINQNSNNELKDNERENDAMSL